MKKILIIHQSLPADSNLAKLYNSFWGDFEIKFVCPYKIKYWLWFWEWIFRNLDFEKFKNITVRPLNLISDKNPFLRTLYWYDLFKTIKDFKPDIIHCYTEIFSPTLAEAIFFRNMINKGIKVMNFSWENLDWTNKIPHSYFWKYSAKHIDKVICANEQAVSEVHKFWVRTDRISKIYWWVDFSNFEFIKHSVNWKSKFKIWFIWRLLKDKWIQNLIEAIKILWENYSLELIWDWADKEYFEKLTRELEISDRINFIWKVEYSNLKKYIAEFDIFVLASLSKSYWEEQFWRVLVEMMASWVPVIWSSSWAIPEVIWDRWLVFREGDSEDLADKIKQLSLDEKSYNEYIIKAYDYALNNYSQEVFKERLKKVYND
ncbi:MAG: glycosyl transferase group 1 [uncultured bacterium (gcode 4)]|uniref:Glycosyl transferase group 1 n=1 Tax=uncultured bacterium (gcode 4) TaxID=1234023 RepID=K2G1Z3_9BACT|nr:MAG: glycosyl transferase group 1 [uncultured bacterium (gcode 4)]